VNAVAAEVVSQGGNAHPVICDVTDDSSVKAAFREIVSIGDIEVLAP
jgi:NAD(P)-dependent dehydrogenase (short-subunit alcohol dehydrogenase family)